MADTNQQDVTPTFSTDGPIPNHVAIIMDGNGRWAKKQGKPRFFGHRVGMDNVRRIAVAANDIGIKVLTVYAFSTENWGRPKSEVDFLMKMPLDFYDKYMPEIQENDIKVIITGLPDKVPEKTKNMALRAADETKDNKGMILNFAFNYGGRADIVTTTRKISALVKSGELEVDEITEDVFNDHLLTADLKEYSDVDLMIRTSGEQRISNFLLWQIAYSELVFNDTSWPEYDEENLKKDVAIYQGRNRRYGKLS